MVAGGVRLASWPPLPLRLLVALLLGAQVGGVAAQGVRGTVHVDTKSFECDVPKSISQEDLAALRTRNCLRVNQAVEEFKVYTDQAKWGVANKYISKDQEAKWRKNGAAATELCRLSLEVGDNHTAAQLAVNAWGTKIMEGSECCMSNTPPYLCLEQSLSQPCMALFVLLLALVVMFVGTTVTSCFLRSQKPKAPEEPPAPLRRQSPGMDARAAASQMARSLEEFWMRRHCLRALPDAAPLARSTASLFGALHAVFDFQAGNVRNQHEHLLSLWRSHCASVADRFIEKGEEVSETGLLVEAVGDLHAELMEGFSKWRERFCEEEATGFEDRILGTLPPLAGLRWEAIEENVCNGTDEDAEELSAQLAEIAVYLLVWGEAGNVRFMPEVLYFIVELALAADGLPLYADGLYPAAAAAPLEGGGPGDRDFRSSLFLAQVIRPVYHIICNEWYDCIDIDDKSGRATRKHHQGYDAYLPPDAANYDDWNELFCDPQRLMEQLVLKDGSQFFSLPHGHRFAALGTVDWPRSLEATKTHREVHSLWGVYAATHRVWLLHFIVFFVGVCLVTGNFDYGGDGTPLAGRTAAVRIAAVGLLVPFHALLWGFARWETSAAAGRSCSWLVTTLWSIFWILPGFTYLLVRRQEMSSETPMDFTNTLDLQSSGVLTLHYLVSIAGFASLLAGPPVCRDRHWPLTKVPARLQCVRYFFWLSIFTVKFVLGHVVFQAVYFATRELLGDVSLARTSVSEMSSLWRNSQWTSQMLEWALMWVTTCYFFITDTGMYHAVACTVLGVATVFAQRQCGVCRFALEDAVSKIPDRFSQKILTYSTAPQQIVNQDGVLDQEAAPFSGHFPALWDRVMEFMRYEDKCDNQILGDHSFQSREAGKPVNWDALKRSLRDGPLGSLAAATPRDKVEHNMSGFNSGKGGGFASTTRTGTSTDSPAARVRAGGGRVKVPELFLKQFSLEIFMKHYCCVPDFNWPSNEDLQWRFIALARGLGLPMPRPYRVPYVPGITVFIPHGGGKDRILEIRENLYSGMEQSKPLILWLANKYHDEFKAFTSRMGQYAGKEGKSIWESDGYQWDKYTDEQWEKLCGWASMRLQTLWRTVAGMTMYYDALQCHYEVQADQHSALAKPGIWDPADCFTCLIAMQNYKVYDDAALRDTEKLFEKFPPCLRVAITDWEPTNGNAASDNLHPRQKLRYFSGLIDSSSHTYKDKATRRRPRFWVELPGCYLLGDGKNEAQNFAIPYSRGAFIQCMDMNQGAYFEQMLMLPCVLGEFRTKARGSPTCKRIIGLPEHITSDIGSIGNFAAGAEVAFGTILQRSYAVMGARMHYGHPDIMNKQYMMQQGGVSKATKTLNLSEDIFAGMDFTLRGDGRRIYHCEYFHLAKGRDLGFNAVIGFFSKLSSGTGEQILTRQMLRLHHSMHLPSALSFYYAHGGFYITQLLTAWSTPIMVFTWLLVLCADCDDDFKAFLSCPVQPAGVAMVKLLAVVYSPVLLLYMLATSLPYFAEMWLERSLRIAVLSVAKQYLTLSFMLFIFQAKVIGSYIINEIRYGGATYVSTGRTLPTQRVPFIGRPKGVATEGLYLDYAPHTFYDAMITAMGAAFIPFVGGTPPGSSAGLLVTWLSILVTLASWFYAPFLFNPSQFQGRHFREDFKNWRAFFLRDGGYHWIQWYDKKQLKTRRGFRHSVVDMNFVMVCFILSVWFGLVSQKVWILRRIYTLGSGVLVESIPQLFSWGAFAPPVFISSLYAVLATLMEEILARRRRKAHSVDSDASSSSDDDEGTCTAIPLCVSSLVVVVLQVIECLLVLQGPGGALLKNYSWRRALVAGIILKIFLLETVLFLMEGMLTSRCINKSDFVARCVGLEIHANRMARDILCSGFIFATLAIGVPIHALNQVLCPGCLFQHMLIYRDPGRLSREEALVTDLRNWQGSTEASGGESSEDDHEEARLLPGRGSESGSDSDC